MDDMTPTDKLRALLDERGIEHYDHENDEPLRDLSEAGTDPATSWRMGGASVCAVPDKQGTFDLWIDHCTPEQASAATVGGGMTLDEATEYAEGFMGTYAKLLLASTLYVERDEPTDQHAFNIAEQREAQMVRTLAEALATVGTEPDEPDTLKLHERMNSVLLDMNEVLVPEWHREDISTQKLIDCVIRAHRIIEDSATMGVGTCRAIDTGYATAKCSECDAEFMGSIMTNEPPDYVKPLERCPRCGRRIIEEV